MPAPPPQPIGKDWKCPHCPSKPILGTIVGGALVTRIPLAQHYPDRVVVKCPVCRRAQIFRLDELAA